MIAVLGLAPDRAAVHVRRGHRGLARGPRRDARRDHAPAGAALLPRARTSTACGSRSSGGRSRPRATASRPPRAGATSCSGGPGPFAIAATAMLLAARGPRARHAPRVPRRGQRPAGHHDPPGLRPEHRGVRPRHERAARDRRRAAGRVRAGRGRRARRPACAARRKSPSSPTPRSTRQGDAAIVTVIPNGSPQDEETESLVNRLREDVVPDELGDTGITAEVGGVTAALEDQSDYITDRMPLFIAGVVGLSFLLLLVAFHSPLISLKAGDHEPAVRGRRLRGDDRGREGRGGRRADRDRPRGADRAVHAGDDVRDPVRALDGLRGLPDLADPRGVPEGTGTRAGRSPTAWRRPRA